MEIMSDKWFMAIILLLIILIFVLVTFIVLMGLYLLKNSKDNQNNLQTKPEVIEAKTIDKKNPSIKPTQVSGHCFQHEEAKSVAVCNVCEQEICESCLRHVDHLNFCPDHFETYISNKWTPITNEMTTPDTPEAGIYIYNFKKEIWVNENIPTYILTDYKLNVEGDFIESYVMLHVREQDKDTLQKRIQEKRRG